MVSPFRRRRSKPREPHTIRHSIALTLSTLIAVILVAATVITFHLGVIIDGLLFAPSSIVTDEQKSAIQTKATDLSHQIESEGAVLLRNEDNTLPLSADIKKVNVFGWASTAWMAGGSGSGTVSDWTGNADGIIEALNQAGIKTNAKLTSMYKDFQDGREYTATLRSLPEQSARLYEPSIDDKNYYSDTLLADAEAYSDTAFVVIGRLGGESNDMPRQQYKRTTKGGDIVVDDTRTSLDLSTEEESLLTYVGEHYNHVVVILNTGNVMTLGQLETIPGIDACLHAGLTGTSAASAIPDLLWGKTNPSGRTVDTWAYSLDTAASWANSGLEGVGSYTNADGLYPIGVSNGNLGVEATYDQVSYVDYAEGIYVGYKWYETADAEGYWKDVASEHGNGYEGVVQYPFGYGLSYASFDWEVVQAPSGSFNGDDTLSMIVKVTNTGDMAGKDVVELYYGAPYTPGGIEKSAVNLAALAKTDELRPGQSQEVTLRFDARDMASYDCYDANGNGFAGYELDPGDYTLTLRHNAHTLDDAAGATVTMSLDFGVQYTEDSVSGNTVCNKFTGSSAVDGVSVDGADSGQDIAYTTRADFKGTFPKNNVPERTLGDNAKKLNLYEPEAADIASADGSSDTIVTGAKNGLKLEENGKTTELGYQLGADANDPRWEDLLDQLTVDEMTTLFTNAYSTTAPLDSVGRQQDKNADGPAQIGSMTGIGAGTGFPNATVLAQTWNTNLAQEMGRTVGQQALANGFSGWYAPAVNLHRSPLDGRNYEYYAEDPILSGMMCGNVVQGANEAGVYTFTKHFVANDGESGIYRDSVYTWMTEQTLRETYLEPFRMIVEQYDAPGLMSSYNRIGATWAGGSKALMSSILRDEWGFQGAVITDYCDHHQYMNGDHALDAGGNLWMSGFIPGTLAQDTSSQGTIAKLRQAAKGTLYMQMHVRSVNRSYVQRTGDTSMARPDFNTPGWSNWRQSLLLLDAVFLLFMALSIRGLVIDHRLRKARKGAKGLKTEPVAGPESVR